MTSGTEFSILVYWINSDGTLTLRKKLDKTSDLSSTTNFAGTIYKGKLLYCLNSVYKLVDYAGNETDFGTETFNHLAVFRIGDDVFGIATGTSNQIVNILEPTKNCSAGSDDI